MKNVQLIAKSFGDEKIIKNCNYLSFPQNCLEKNGEISFHQEAIS